MRVPLIREKTENTFKKAAGTTGDGHIHAGLLLNKGYPREDENDNEAKTKFIQSICQTKASTLYQNAFNHWHRLTNDPTRFKQIAMTLENRLLIGLSGTGALETGCAINHTYGMPYIPGSSIKGAVRNWARENLKDCEAQWTALFGSAPEADDKDSFSGLVTFHDAWWMPRSSPIASGGPFTQDIVTTHHPDYYGSSGEKKATDMDNPIPNALIGVHGSFLVVLEGDERYLSVVETMLGKALSLNGIGAKTSSGYGYFQMPDKAVAVKTIEGTGKLEKVSGQYRVILDKGGKSGVLTGEFFKQFKASHLASKAAEKKLKRDFKVKVSYIEHGNQKDVVSIAPYEEG